MPDDEREEVMRLSGAKTKREVILRAIAEFNRRRAEEAIELFGACSSRATNDEVEEPDLQRQRAVFGDTR